MRTLALTAVAILLVITAAASKPDDLKSSAAAPDPALINICVITNDVQKLTAFYTHVLQIEPKKIGDDYVEFHTTAGTLALFAAKAQEKYIPGAATAGQNHSAILEFRVGNVDAEYARLHDFVKSWVKGPTTQPWGTRSIYFRDLDGNLVNFFTAAPSAS